MLRVMYRFGVSVGRERFVGARVFLTAVSNRVWVRLDIRVLRSSRERTRVRVNDRGKR